MRKSSNRKVLETIPRVTFAYGSVEDRASLDAAVKDVEAVIHSAGLVKARRPEDFRLANVTGTANLLAAAREHAPKLRRFVHVSSGAATAPSPDGTPVRNDVTPAPVTQYGWSKLEAERVVKDAAKDLPITIIRPPMVYGPRDTESFQLFQAANRRVLPSIGDPDGKVSCIYGPDCAAAIILAAQKDDVPSGSAYFVTDGRVYSRRDLTAGLERAVGKTALVAFPVPTSVVRVAAFFSERVAKARDQAVIFTSEKVDELVGQWVFDGSDAERMLGFSPRVHWDEGAERSARWYRDNGWL